MLPDKAHVDIRYFLIDERHDQIISEKGQAVQLRHVSIFMRDTYDQLRPIRE